MRIQLFRKFLLMDRNELWFRVHRLTYLLQPAHLEHQVDNFVTRGNHRVELLLVQLLKVHLQQRYQHHVNRQRLNNRHRQTFRRREELLEQLQELVSFQLGEYQLEFRGRYQLLQRHHQLKELHQYLFINLNLNFRILRHHII